MHRLWKYVARYRWRYTLGIVCLLATAQLGMRVPFLLKQAIDAISPGNLATVANFALQIALISAVQAVVRTLSRILIFNVGRDVEYDLRNDLFAHLETLSLRFYQRQQTGDLMSRLVNDVTAVRMLLGPGLLNLVNTPIYYFYALGYMLSLDAWLTFAALLPYPLVLLLVKRFSRRMMEQTLRVQEGLAALSTQVQENLSGIHVIRSYACEQSESRRFAELNESFRMVSMRLARTRGQMMPIMRSASSLGTLVVLWLGGMEVIRGRISIGDLVAFIAYLNMLAWPTMALGWMLSILQRGRAAMQRLEHIFGQPAEIRDGDNAQPLVHVDGDVEFRNVTFAYEADGQNGAARKTKPTLEAVSFHLKPGQKLALVGRTGSGKSTVASLLPRLFDVEEGQILIGGKDIRDWSLRDLRRTVAMVPQEPFLFSTTIRDNIRFGVDEADATAITAAARLAAVDEDIEAFPKGYDTMVGERGITLSGGQKQRITLARALLADPRILVLDDALSSVDTRTESRILRSLAGLQGTRTSIVIAHRISTVQDADVIVVVDRGRVAESGDHSSLLARNGIYAEMFRQQRLEEELAEL